MFVLADDFIQSIWEHVVDENYPLPGWLLRGQIFVSWIANVVIDLNGIWRFV
jgi:hypothetical protein